MSILRFLGLAEKSTASEAPAETETVRKIVDALDHMDPAQARYVAAFAYILSRVAQVDLRVSPEETRTMEQIVTQIGGLPEEQAIIVVQMAKTRSLLFGATENYLVTKEFNRIATTEQKLALLGCLFAVSAAEDSISTLEDNEISQISGELQLDRRDYLAVRYGYRDKLSVLKR